MPLYDEPSVRRTDGVGAAVGAGVGASVSDVGTDVGPALGAVVGEVVGARVGDAVGAGVGTIVQDSCTHSMHLDCTADKKVLQHASHVHTPVGSQLRSGCASRPVGIDVGEGVGAAVGAVVGIDVGPGVGANVFVGAAVGAVVGTAVGAGDGNGVGEGVGVAATLYTTPPILISSPTKMLVLRSTAQPTSTSPFVTATVASRGSHA